MNELELILTGGILGATTLAVLGFALWMVFDMAKSYTDQQIREATKEAKRYTRNYND